MKILMVSQMVPYLPCYDGFRLCPANLMRCLSTKHQIHLAAVAEGSEAAGEREWSEAYCASTTLARQEDCAAAVLDMIRRLRPDVCHIEGPALAPLGAQAAAYLPVVLSIHDSLALRCRDFARYLPRKQERLKAAFRAMMAARYEKRWYGQVQRVVVFSAEDRDALKAALPEERIAIIPNGIDGEHWSFDPDPVRGRLVFTGNMNWPPNVDAAAYFATEVFPKVVRANSEAEFWIVGANPCQRVRELGTLPGVYVTGSVADMRQHLRNAAVYVSPVRFGAGVKNKVLEAMATGAPIVATPRSLTGSCTQDGRDLLVAEQTDDFARAVIRLLEDGNFARRLAIAARAFAERECSWEQAAAKFELLYREAGNAPEGALERCDEHNLDVRRS